VIAKQTGQLKRKPEAAAGN